MHLRRAAALLVCTMTCAVASPALADGDPGKLTAAAEEFDEGTKAFKRKDYEEAGAHFEAADRYAPSAGALGNAIRARKAGKQIARAATLSAHALIRFPDDKALADVAKDFIKQNEKSLQRFDVSCTPGCTLVLDGKVASAEPVTAYVMYVDAGAHTLLAGWSGDRSKSKQVDAKKGSTDPLAFEAPPEKAPAPPPSDSAVGRPPATGTTEPPPPPPEAPHKPLPPLAVYGGAGATAILLGVSIWSGIDTKNNPGTDRVRAECAGQPSDCPAFAQGKHKELRTDILFGATAVVGIATGVAAVFFTDWKGGPSTESPPTAGQVRVVPTFGLDRRLDKNVGFAASALFLGELG